MIARTTPILVSVGEMRGSSVPDHVLTTCVGSCVAVGLWDGEKRIAGLLHAVMPERAGAVCDEASEAYYVDSGFASLLKEVMRQGARRDCLRAEIVGGATVLPSSRGEPPGARNVAAARTLLEQARIPYRAEHVGGHQARRVSLFVGNGAIDVVDSSRRTPRDWRVSSPEASELASTASWLEALGPNPGVAGLVLESLHDRDVDWQRVRQAVASDLVLALHVLRLANSNYGAPGAIGSLEAALGLLGPEQVRRLIILAATSRHAPRTLADIASLEPALRRHSLATALVARRLADGLVEPLRLDVFSAGLLHAVGVIPQSAGMGPRAIGAVELAALMLAWWRLPEGIAETVRWHQAPAKDSIALADVLHDACAIAHLLGIPCPLAPSLLFVPLPSPTVLEALASDLRAAGLHPSSPGGGT